MKTKLFTLLVALLATSNLWAKFQYGNLYYETLSSNTVEVVGYMGEPTSVSIPSIVQYNSQQYTVTSIGKRAFSGCSSLTSITIPNSVTSIGYEAFRYCRSLSSVTIPNSVTSIGDYAFSGCYSLTSITIPNSVTRIGNDAFQYCSSLTSITIPNSVTSIGTSAFSGCYSLTSITIPNSVTSIGSGAFEDCSSLMSITIPNSVTSIGWYAFYNCESLTSITIPNSVTSIGNGAFYYCYSLTSITIPNSVTSIGEEAFCYCTSLTSIIVESGNTTYDSRNNCNAIIETATNTLITGCKNTIIPNSVTSIGESAFVGCSSLTSITIPNSVTSIGEDAFAYCSSLKTVICKAVLVPSTGSYVFDGVETSSAVLYVPEEAVDIYKYMEPWSSFGSILPISQLPSDVEDIQMPIDNNTSMKKIIRNGQVIIRHNDKSYNIMGQEVE